MVKVPFPILNKNFLKGNIYENKKIVSSADNNSISNILIVDDDISCLTTLELLLKKENYHVIKIDNGTLALEYLSKYYQAIDLILLDLMMPGISGFDVINTIEGNNFLKTIPIIIQSGVIDEEIIMSITNTSVKGFITKPYKKQELIDIISSLNKN